VQFYGACVSGDWLMLTTELMAGDLGKSIQLPEWRWYRKWVTCPGPGLPHFGMQAARAASGHSLQLGSWGPKARWQLSGLDVMGECPAAARHRTTWVEETWKLLFSHRLSCLCSWLISCRGRQVAMDVARGLAFMHANNIVHFDLKSR
jgi:hypothetical protein